MPAAQQGVYDIKSVAVNATADGANVILAGIAGTRFVVVGGVLVQTGAAASDLRASGGSVRMNLLAGSYPLYGVQLEFPNGEGISTNNGAASDITGVLNYYEVKQ